MPAAALESRLSAAAGSIEELQENASLTHRNAVESRTIVRAVCPRRHRPKRRSIVGNRPNLNSDSAKIR
jgi:hypothetical protein